MLQERGAALSTLLRLHATASNSCSLSDDDLARRAEDSLIVLGEHICAVENECTSDLSSKQLWKRL